jgi:WD40 repeat protein
VITWKAHKSTVLGVEFSPDCQRLATYEQNGALVRVWNPVARAEVAVFAVPGGQSTPAVVTCIAFSRCGRYFAVGGAEYGSLTRPRLCVWQLATGAMIDPFIRPPNVPTALVFTPGNPPGLFVVDGRLSHFPNAFTGAKSTVHTRGPKRKSPKASRVVLSPDLKWVATNGRDRALVWDAKTLEGKYLREHPRGPQHGPAAFDPHSEVLAVAHGTKVDLWRFAEPKAAVVELTGHKLPVWAVAFLPDGTGVQTASSDGTVRVWDTLTGTERKRYDFGIGKLYCAAFSPDGLTCAAGGENGQVVVWDVDG